MAKFFLEPNLEGGKESSSTHSAHDSKAAQVLTSQQLLFPSMARTICEEMGLNWWAALKLHEDGWLSFSPETATRLDESQEAELRFVGALVIAGCDRSMLSSLLSGLPKPYAYYGNKLYYDWTARHWRLLPDLQSSSEAQFADWLEALVEQGDANSLAGILELAHDALARVRRTSGQVEFYPPTIARTGTG